MTASGIDAQLGFAAEGTYDTYSAPDHFAEFNDESLVFERERIESGGIRPGRRILHRWAPGVQRVTGDINQEFGPHGSALWLEHLFGQRDTTGASDPYTHTFTTGDLDDKSLTIQIGRPAIDGTVIPFSYTGCKFTDFEFSCNVNEYLMLKTSVYGANEDTSQDLEDPTYASGFSPFVFTQGVVAIASSEYEVTAASLAGANNLKIDRHFIRGTNPERPKMALEEGLREFTGSLTSDFVSTAAYNRFKNGTEAALTLTFTQSVSRTLTITMNVRYDGDTPNIGGREIPELTLPYKCVSAVGDSTAFSAVLKNADSMA